MLLKPSLQTKKIIFWELYLIPLCLQVSWVCDSLILCLTHKLRNDGLFLGIAPSWFFKMDSELVSYWYLKILFWLILPYPLYKVQKRFFKGLFLNSGLMYGLRGHSMTTWTLFCHFLTTTYLYVDTFNPECRLA